MYPIDVLSAFTISGIGALVGAVMMLIAMQGDRAQRPALRGCFWGFVALAVGLAQNGFTDRTARWPIMLSAAGALVGTLLVSRGTLSVTHDQPPPRRVFAEVAAVLLVLGVAWPRGPYVFGVVVQGLGLVVTGAVAYGMRRPLLHPRNAAELAMAATLWIYSATFVHGLYSAVVYDGPERRHLLYSSEPIVTVYAVTYALMPLIVASMVLNLVNARLGERLKLQASTDELTGLLSRRALLERAAGWHRAVHGRGRLAVLMVVDADHFKAINDTRGHDAGDTVLRVLAQRMQRQLRRDALLGRYGGEEFLVLVETRDAVEAAAVAERLRMAVAGTPFSLGARTVDVSISIGVATWPPGMEFAQAMALADAALYAAKRGGRNRVAMDDGTGFSVPEPAVPGTP